MATGRSFAEYVKGKCYNGSFYAVEEYANDSKESLNLLLGMFIGSVPLN